MLVKAFTGYKPPKTSAGAAGAMTIAEFFKRIPTRLPSDDNIAGLVADLPEGVIKRGL